ncbi:hypothetical protein [Krasilnikovia sp. MM14-A1259]|uniref:hypothetical protein n=1 Tax=Krasilnikovia sp. MM14-A1259 TaxID=3373539 RepID=UPI0038298061
MADTRTRRRFLVLAMVIILAGAGIAAVLLTRKPEAAPVKPAPVAGPPAGIVTIGADPSGTGSVLYVHDPLTGALTRTLTLPDTVLHPTNLGQFTPDLSLVTWRDPDTIHVAQLRGDRYEQIAAWGPDQLHNGITAQYESLAMAPDGRVWAKATLRAGDARQIEVLSFDPAHPTAPARMERGNDVPAGFDRTGTSASPARLPITGAPGTTATVLTTTAELLPGDVTVTASAHDELHLSCPEQLEASTLLCFSAQTSRYGRVAVLRRNAGGLALDTIVPATEAPVDAVLLSPDHSQLRMRTSTGWRGVRLDGTPVTVAPLAHPDGPLAWR